MKKSFPFKKISVEKISVLLAASLACLVGSGLTQSDAAPTPVAAPALVRLPGHVGSDIVHRSALVGRKSGTDVVPLALTLKLRDPAGLERLLQRQYTPGDPLFHHFITPAEFTTRFCPTAQTYQKVAAFAQANGLTVTHTHATRLLLEVSGSASKVEAAFHLHLQNFQSPIGRVFHAPDSDPAIPAALAGSLAGVVGLQNTAISRPHNIRRQATPLTVGVNPIGSGPGGGLTPNDVKNAYDLSKTPLTGKGQTLALFELDGYMPSDITTYEAAYNLPNVPLQNVAVSGGVPTLGDGAGEVTLDIELMTALAPGAKAIYVYEAPNDDTGATTLAIYTQIAQDDIAKQISSSWGRTEDPQYESDAMNSENTLFQQLAAQGQSMYAAAGDSGAYDDGFDLTVDDPASQPYVTGVGGTSLKVFGLGGPYVSESTWSDPNDNYRSFLGAGGGGGISEFWPIPDYQTGLPHAASQMMRNVPDVSLDADPNTGYSIYFTDPTYGAGYYIFGGTSCAAPLWAAFTALVNQQREANGTADLGFANPIIYTTAQSAAYATAFHDIDDNSDNLYWVAVPGYDDATGWGSFDGAGLLAQFAPAAVVAVNPVSSLTLTPASVVGGLTSNAVVTLTNPAPTGGATVTITVGSGPASAPATVQVAAGATTADFTVTTTAVTAAATASITAAYGGGSRSATLTVTPPPAVIAPMSLTLNPSAVAGGASSVGTVTLNGPAPTGGVAVTLSSSSPAVTVPSSVTVPAGAVSATFPITTAPVATQVAATLTATLNGVSQTAVLTVQAPAVEQVLVAPSSVFGGDSAVLTVALTLPAPAGGAAVALSSSSSAAPVPASVLIPAGQTMATVPITTTVVPATIPVTLSATFGGVTKNTILIVKAALLQGLSLAPPQVVGGQTTVLTLSLGSSTPSTGVTAVLSCSSPSAQVPATLFIPAGATSASVAVPTSGVSASVTATITAVLGTATETVALTIQPIGVASLSLSPPSVQVGTAITGTLRLNAPAPVGGLSVALSSSGPAATAPATVTVPAGSATATFLVATPHAGTATLSAQLAGSSQTASLTVSGAPGTSYPAGLNMISAPYDYSGVPLDSLFGYTGVLLATWQPASGAYALTPTAPADAMHIGVGYWVNLPSAVTLSSVGTPANPAQDFSIALSPGWNQIGQPWPTGETVGSLNVSANGTTLPFDQAAASSPLLISSLVYRWSPSTGTTAGSYVYVRDTDSLQPGLGYWIYAYQAATLIVPHH